MLKEIGNLIKGNEERIMFSIVSGVLCSSMGEFSLNNFMKGECNSIIGFSSINAIPISEHFTEEPNTM